MWWVWLVEAALAGQIYVNGAPVDPAELAGTTWEQAEVRFDEEGNVHLEVSPAPIAAEPTPSAPSEAEPTPPSEPTSPSEPTQAGESAPPSAPSEAGLADAGPDAAQAPAEEEAWPQPSSSSVTLSRISARGLHPSGVPEARWWLVVEDDASVGHTVEILINDELVQTVRSGEIPRILDVGGHLVPGGNRVLLRSTSEDARGGPLYVYLGHGSDRDGTVMLEQPEVQFALGASRSGTYQREYTLNVD